MRSVQVGAVVVIVAILLAIGWPVWLSQAADAALAWARGFIGTDSSYAALLGVLLGAVELMGRYRDEPVRVFAAGATWFYLFINGVLAAVSLYLIYELGLAIEVGGAQAAADAGAAGGASGGGAAAQAVADDTKQRIYNIIFAGFGGAAFFRSSVMKTKVSDTDVAIGPAIVIDTLLKVTDRQVDRFRARRRASSISNLMAGINLDQASRLVIPFCTALMQNVGAAERERLQQAVLSLGKDTNVDSKTKPMVLGLRLVNMIGFGVLESAVQALRAQGLLGRSQAEPSSILSQALSSLSKLRAAHGDDDEQEPEAPGSDGDAPAPPDAAGSGDPEPGAADDEPAGAGGDRGTRGSPGES